MKIEGRCLNCGSILQGKHCHQCGQKAGVGRLTFRSILSDFFSSAFNLEGPFFQSLICLFRSPGSMIRAYLKGERKRYYSPVKYLLLCLLIFVVAEKLSGYDPVSIAMEGQGRDLSGEGARSSRFILHYINYFSLLLPFCLALISYLFYWKSPLNMAERTAAGFYIGGQYMLLNLLPLALSFIHPNWIAIRYILSIAYFAYAFYSLFQKAAIWWRMVKSVLASFLTIIFYYALSWWIAHLLVTYLNVGVE